MGGKFLILIKELKIPPTHICVIMLLHGVWVMKIYMTLQVVWFVTICKDVDCWSLYNITGYVNCCWNIVIDNCMICGLCDLLKRRKHYKLCDLFMKYADWLHGMLVVVGMLLMIKHIWLRVVRFVVLNANFIHFYHLHP